MGSTLSRPMAPSWRRMFVVGNSPRFLRREGNSGEKNGTPLFASAASLPFGLTLAPWRRARLPGGHRVRTLAPLSMSHFGRCVRYRRGCGKTTLVRLCHALAQYYECKSIALGRFDRFASLQSAAASLRSVAQEYVP